MLDYRRAFCWVWIRWFTDGFIDWDSPLLAPLMRVTTHALRWRKINMDHRVKMTVSAASSSTLIMLQLLQHRLMNAIWSTYDLRDCGGPESKRLDADAAFSIPSSLFGGWRLPVRWPCRPKHPDFWCSLVPHWCCCPAEIINKPIWIGTSCDECKHHKQPVITLYHGMKCFELIYNRFVIWIHYRDMRSNATFHIWVYIASTTSSKLHPFVAVPEFLAQLLKNLMHDMMHALSWMASTHFPVG